MHLYFGIFQGAATIQGRPLLAWVRYVDLLFIIRYLISQFICFSVINTIVHKEKTFLWGEI